MKKQTKIAIIAVTVIILLTASGLILTRRNGQIDGMPNLARLPKETETVNVLVCGVDYSQKLTDVIIYMRYEPKSGTAKLLSIPRDTYIGDDVRSGKINAVMQTEDGIDGLVSEVEKRFLLQVDYHATITLESLGAIVDDIGGVPIVMEEDLYDNGALLFPAGAQTLDGEQAQMFVRLRHAYANADLGRIEAQHKFLLALMEKLQSMGKLDMLRLVTSHFGDVTTDMPLTKALSIASTAFSIKAEDIESFTVPGVGKMHNTYAVYEVDRAALSEILNQNFFSSPRAADDLDFPTLPEWTAPASTPAPEQKPVEESEQKDWGDEGDEPEESADETIKDKDDVSSKSSSSKKSSSKSSSSKAQKKSASSEAVRKLD